MYHIHTFSIGDIVHVYDNAHRTGEDFDAEPTTSFNEVVVVSLSSTRFPESIIAAHEDGGVCILMHTHYTGDRYKKIIGNDPARAAAIMLTRANCVNLKGVL